MGKGILWSITLIEYIFLNDTYIIIFSKKSRYSHKQTQTSGTVCVCNNNAGMVWLWNDMMWADCNSAKNYISLLQREEGTVPLVTQCNTEGEKGLRLRLYYTKGKTITNLPRFQFPIYVCFSLFLFFFLQNWGGRNGRKSMRMR